MKKLTIRRRTIKAVRGFLIFEGPVWGWQILVLPRQCWRFDYHKFDSGAQWSIRFLVVAFGWWKK